jgi:hypothetical protein
MGYVLNTADNVEYYASTSALSSTDASEMTEGTWAAVTGGYLYQLFKNGAETVDDTLVLTATGGGQWQEVFTYTGRNYLLISDTDNTLSNISLGSITNADISASAAIAYSKLAALTTNNILAGVSNVATVCAVAGDLTMTAAGTTATFAIGANKVTKAMLATTITPSHIVIAAGTTSYAGGSTSTTQTVGAALAGDLVIATMTNATNAVYMRQAALSGTTITYTFSADPGAATTINYQVLRAAT